MSTDNDSIAAIATPPGRGGVGIVRVSGERAAQVMQQVVRTNLKPRYATYTPFYDAAGEIVDSGIALWFPAPHSYTGECVLELQGHGGPMVMQQLLAAALAAGARLARPGEFTERAFLNNKMDLVQAEAVATLINASTEQAARAASRAVQGRFSAHINTLLELTINLRLHVEAAIDFPEEEIDFLADTVLQQKLSALVATLQQTLTVAKQGQLLAQGATVVIAGKPNAGKSSLINQLTGQSTAIVTDIPGTTRDKVSAEINCGGVAITLTDTAGLRDTQDPVELLGIARTTDALAQADVLLWVMDSQQEPDPRPFLAYPELQQILSEQAQLIVVQNKIDLSAQTPAVQHIEGIPVVSLSAVTGAGLPELQQQLLLALGGEGITAEAEHTASLRHVTALEQTLAHVLAGQHNLQQSQAGELLAEELKLAQDCLSEITGEFTADDLLGKIFSEFCIGK